MVCSDGGVGWIVGGRGDGRLVSTAEDTCDDED